MREKLTIEALVKLGYTWIYTVPSQLHFGELKTLEMLKAMGHPPLSGMGAFYLGVPERNAELDLVFVSRC